MTVVSKSFLLEAGVHFGHQTKRWNPKMKEYIFTSRDDIYIIDLEKTVEKLEEAYAEILRACAGGGQVLFVGTKKQAQEVSVEEATRCKSFYVTQRWLGGTLTNFKTIRDRVKRMIDIEKMQEEGKFELLPKKEVVKIQKEYDKLNKILCGIRDMVKLPKVLIITDPRAEINAIREARILHIPVIGIVDTNADPDDVDFVIPGNDDAVRSVKVMLGVLANAVCEANNLELVDYVTEQDNNNARINTIKEEVKVELPKIEIDVKTVAIKEEDLEENYAAYTVTDLKKLAKKKKIKGYTSMKKADLIKAIKSHK